jgi:hypothetical protein
MRWKDTSMEISSLQDRSILKMQDHPGGKLTIRRPVDALDRLAKGRVTTSRRGTVRRLDDSNRE